MEDLNLKIMLKLLNYLLGTFIIVLSFYLFYKKSNITPLYIALAIITAGPLEDILVRVIKSTKNIPPDKKREYLMLVDQLTSVGFLIFLLLAIITSSH